MITNIISLTTFSSQHLGFSQRRDLNFASTNLESSDVCILLVKTPSGLCRRELILATDTPYENIKKAQDWWKTVDLPDQEKEAVARGNAIRAFKLPLEE